jgi:hypothetical protein
MLYHFTRVSSNRKTGPMPVVTSSKKTCPTSCPLQDNGCYAEAGPLAILWKEVTSGRRGISFAELCRKIRRLPRGQTWRYGQAGDAKLGHLRAAADKGLHINLSADSLAEADELSKTGLSVVTILSSEYGRNHQETLAAYRTRRKALPNHTPGGLRVAVCPATYLLDVTCVECQVCSGPRPNGTVMGFPAHANKAASVDAVFTVGHDRSSDVQLAPMT